MKLLFSHRRTYIFVTIIVIIIVILMARGVSNRDTKATVTATVEVGPVRELVSVSGIAKAEQLAELAFPAVGIVDKVNVKKGDLVQEGDILVTLDATSLYADRQDALAAVRQAVANRDELLAGLTSSAREVTNETVATAKETLTTIKVNEEQKVANAYRTLLSTDLTAHSNDPNEDAAPPTVTGTYSCKTGGTYVLDMYNSASQSGYSYRLSGIETGTYVASVDQPIALGNCGLRVQFETTSKYNQTEWIIDIPNTKSSQYVTNENAYNLAVTQANSAIANATQALALAEAQATNQEAPARSEAIDRANAAVDQARARVSKIDAAISDRILRAPFTSTITEIDLLPGETVGTTPVVTLLASGEFEVTARIPEIDIGKLLVGQKVEMVFDAKSDTTLTGVISFISLKSTEIDGVAYYEAIIKLNEIPQWIRSGLNADIDIIITERDNVLRVPKRFVTKTDTGYVVLVQKNGVTATSSIGVELTGNDGYVAITGLTKGDTLVAPTP